MEQHNKGWFKRTLQSICRNKYIWLAFAIAFLPRLPFVLQSVPVSIGGDEIFAMGPAAKLVGYDWSGVMQDYRYYGYGYTVLLVPFFKLIHDPILLYRMIVLLMALAQSVSAPISYHLMKQYFHVDNEKILCVSSICCSYLVAVRAVYTYPEFIYVLVMWLLAWVLLRMNSCVDDYKKKIIYTVVLVLVLFYASTVHSRATAVWMAVAFGVVYYGWAYRKTLVSIPVCLVMGTGAFVVSQKGMEAVLDYFVKASSSGIANTGVSFSIGYLLEDIKSWPAWVNIIIGQLNEAVIVTGGLAIFAVIAILILLWRGLIRAKSNMAEVYQMSPYMVVGSIFMAAVIVTIGGQSISWLGGVTSAMFYEGDPDAFRAITYFRYYGAYVGPLLMAGIAYFYHKRQALGKLYPVVCVTAALLQGYWVVCILPFISEFNGSCWDFAPYSLTKGFEDVIRLRTYLPGTFIVFLILLISYILYRYNKTHIILGLLCIMLIYCYCFNALYHEGYRGQKNYTYVDDSVQLLNDLKKEAVLPDKIYVEDGRVGGIGQQTKYLYQFNLLDKPVVSAEPPKNETEAIFLCQNPKEWSKLIDEGYLCGKIAEHEYIYVLGDQLKEKIGETGITLTAGY
ncbi:hypothetical protein EAI89_11795 [Eubacterium sp. am_0171]|uniref:Uncharacterized protein n=1 Tax=Faecalicatena contorta TaxID=39482 RepID=A0A174HV48_9FIRM|nr:MULTISPECIES: hypothetical protein [Clostridia]MSC84789.1 hypothetical protein [Eubacterium sp. BIOML-A1]MSD06854.1 hypothetical protein [Eubacterium sp. BIOML-A2]RYT17621.1 hypothetical protein EAI89_11795 [Eubacterium sp. am_0171]CUO76930.1 Uncharacterised protein [[Eubacterium] contortum] [Faecalicatena contorta]